MSDIAPTQDPLPVPPCPAWCTLAPHDFDSETDTGWLMRGHGAGDWPAVPTGAGYDCALVSACADEIEGDGVGPLSVHVTSPGVWLTADEARRLAAFLVAAADRCDLLNVTP